MTGAVRKRLGERAAELYARVAQLVELAIERNDQPARADLAAIGLSTLRGEWHDYRSGHPLPKGDLVIALRSVRCHESAIAGAVGRLIDDVVRGEFADGAAEAKRMVAGMVSAAAPAERKVAGHEAIDLTERERRVFVWLYRYTEVYRQGPLLREVADGLQTTEIAINGVLRDLERKGAVARLGGKRGWLPVRSP